MTAGSSHIVAAVVVAAGAGTRMGARKQFLDLADGERIVDRAIAVCRSVAGWVCVVVPPGETWSGPSVDAVVEGGTDRSTSIAVGVAAVPAEAGILVVHSASHPLASPALAQRVVKAIEDGADGAVPILAAADTIKRRNPDGSLTTIGRDGLGAAQAPMAYRRATLDRALAQCERKGEAPVEESMAVEAVGGRVVAVAGELTNLHLTDRASLAVIRHLAGFI